MALSHLQACPKVTAKNAVSLKMETLVARYVPMHLAEVPLLVAGPNMAGKSTVLRSLCAVALLAACGLLVPAARAKLPYTDAFILRNFAADSPLEGRSSFAVEMIEMRYASVVWCWLSCPNKCAAFWLCSEIHVLAEVDELPS